MSILCVSIKTKHFPLDANVEYIGKDLLVIISGGESHIGAIAMAQPRPSLGIKSKTSSTSSVFCYLGHKEDEIVKPIANILAAKLNTKVIVIAGVHWDNLSNANIKQIKRNVNKLCKKILDVCIEKSI